MEIGAEKSGHLSLSRRGVAIPTALFFVLLIFTLATITVKRASFDLRYTNLAADRTQKHFLAKAAVATAMAKLNSGEGNEADTFDTSLESGDHQILDEPWGDFQLEVSVHKVNGSSETLRFEGKAFPVGHPELAEVYNSTIVKQHQNNPVLAASTPATIGGVLSGIHFRVENMQANGERRGRWNTLPPALAYDYGPGGNPVPSSGLLVDPFHTLPQLPAWFLTMPTLDQTGKLYVHFHTISGIQKGQITIYQYDTVAGAGDILLPDDTATVGEFSGHWKVLPPIPLGPPSSNFPLLPPHAAVYSGMTCDGNGDLIVTRHNLEHHALWKFHQTAEPAPGEVLIPGTWTHIAPPEELSEQPHVVLFPAADDEGNLFAMWSPTPQVSLIDVLLQTAPDAETGELEFNTLGVNTIYRLPTGTTKWELLSTIPDMYHGPEGQVEVGPTAATKIGGMVVTQSGEIYVQNIRDGADAIMKYAGGHWHILPRAASQAPDGGGEVEDEFADWNNFCADSRMVLYGKDPNVEDGRLTLDTMYRYKGGHFDVEQPVTKPPLRYDLTQSSHSGIQRILEMRGGGIVTDRDHYQFVPIASF
jgi:hypothetical protein